MHRRASAIGCMLIAALASGCSTDSSCSSDVGLQTDAATRIDGAATAVDAGESDAGKVDAGKVDAGEVDAGEQSDAGEADAGKIDAGGQSDAGTNDGAIDAPPDGGAPDAANDTTVGWVLSYFGNNQDLPSDSLHLAYSMDGLKWTELNGGLPVYQLSGLGTNHIRDPFIVRKLDGTFVYLATDWTLAQNDSNYWNRPSGKLVMVDSPDLITFTNPRLVTVTTLQGPNSSQMHAWAPEAFYDTEKGQYAILWSGNDTAWVNRIYVSYTNDFQSVSDPANPTVYFYPDYTVIDASPLRATDRNYLFFKDESSSDIQIARSTSTSMAPGAFTRMSPEYITRGANQTVSQGTEGPFAIQAPNQNLWYLYADRYSKGGVFGGWKTTNLNTAPSSWTEMSSTEFSFPPGVRHANVVRVTQAQLEKIIAHYGVTPIVRLRTTYSEGGSPFYIAHSWYHLMITYLSDTSHGQLPNDFRWKAVPGLADPTNPALVSFIPAGFPDRFLRINSANPGTYPTCTTANPPNAANRGTALCAVPSSQQNHLAWADTYVDSDTFRSDATFRKVAALNGDSKMVSLQWYGDSTRYLRHFQYQVFATPLSPPPATDYAEASFTLEPE
jgi:hypothetical protein